MDFDSEKPFWVRHEFALNVIDDAWLAQFAGDTWLSRIIAYGTQGPHSHSAMCRRYGPGMVDLLELREFHGGRIRPLRAYRDVAGRVDVFSPCAGGILKDRFSPGGAVAAMRELTAYDYGYGSVAMMALRRIPLIWRAFGVSTSDTLPGDNPDMWQPFCSHAVSLSLQRGGHVDVVPRCPHFAVTPSQLTTSMFFEYEFSLFGTWAEKQRRYADVTPAVLRANEEEYVRRHPSGDSP